MIREESEGFLTLFSVLQSNEFTKAFEIVGSYDLDPNKAADIIITVFTRNTAETRYLELLKLLNLKTLPHVFGLKFQNVNEKCKSLCEVAAACIKAGLFDIQSIWPYLKPESLQKVFEDQQKLVQNVKRLLDVYVIQGITEKT